MDKVKTISKKLYYHTFVRYLAIGGTTFAIQATALFLFHGLLLIALPIAVTLAYWLSVTFNFTANRLWSFEATHTHVSKHAIAYGMLLAANYAFTISFITIATHFGMMYMIAQVLAVGIQVSWTYLIYKKIIFK